jgi:hypothetical protein
MQMLCVLQLLSMPLHSISRLSMALQDNRETAERMLTHGEQLLAEWKHPDPIIGEYSSCRLLQ